jgi:enoyl-CoA hydratase/carnithine racemase
LTPRSFVDVTKREHVGIVSLARPEALNALSGAVARELGEALRAVATDTDVWAVVLAAAGDRAFCVGADLKERSSFSLADYHVNRAHMQSMFAAVRAVPQPCIAAIFGHALGGGLELALSCDIIVAATDAHMGLTEARVGLVPAGGGTQLLARRVGVGKAKELVFTGARLDAQEALAIGLVDRVVAREELDAAALALARDICGSSPVAVRAAKGAIDAALGTSVPQGLELEHAAWSVVIASEDRAEGIDAFNAKRAPRWSNR